MRPFIGEATRREMKRQGFRFGAYDGATCRRFVLFTRHDASSGNEKRREFDTKGERDTAAINILAALAQESRS